MGAELWEWRGGLIAPCDARTWIGSEKRDQLSGCEMKREWPTATYSVGGCHPAATHRRRARINGSERLRGQAVATLKHLQAALVLRRELSPPPGDPAALAVLPADLSPALPEPPARAKHHPEGPSLPARRLPRVAHYRAAATRLYHTLAHRTRRTSRKPRGVFPLIFRCGGLTCRATGGRGCRQGAACSLRCS